LIGGVNTQAAAKVPGGLEKRSNAMQKSYLIKGGTVVDGTGAAPFAADIRVRGSLIAEIAPSLKAEPRERVIDASGCFVTPGFIESHNHFDAPMWWMPTLEPMPGYGVTTSINGNCGFAAAPVHEDPLVRKEMVDIFSFFEDIPDKPFLKRLFRDDRAVGNLADSGAHGKMFCGIGDNVLLLTKYVRDEHYLKIEEAVRILTGQPADHFGMQDRGVIKTGKQADIVVFDLAEIERRKDEKVYDVPDGEGGRTYRYSRAPAPMRLTMVNGVPTFDQGAFTGKFPGRCVGPTGARSTGS
jgi:N-acyl-D-aspartate/D-glutamate deacylase